MGKMPSKWKIMEWWTNHIIDIKKDNPKRYNQLPIHNMDDIGEPDCWACGRYDPNFNDIGAYCKKHKTSKGIAKMWNSASLERHHIIPKSLGGLDDPSNLFLLCNSCHKEAPHVNDYDVFLLWAKNREQEKISIYIDYCKYALLSNGESSNKFEFVNELLKIIYLEDHPLHKELSTCISKNLTFHGEGGSEVYFRDKLTIAIKVAKEKNWTLEYLEKVTKND